jgi:hypothetical protein
MRQYIILTKLNNIRTIALIIYIYKQLRLYKRDKKL